MAIRFGISSHLHVRFSLICLLVLSCGSWAGEPLRLFRAEDLHPLVMLRSRSGVLWCGGVQGLFQFDGYDLQRVRLRADPQPEVYHMVEDRRGRLWVGTSEGLFRIHNDGRVIAMPLRFENDLERAHLIEFTMLDQQMRLWLAMNDTLMVWDLRDDRLDPGGSAPNHRQITALYEDLAGRFWVGSQNGLWRFERENGTFLRALPQFEQHVTTLTEDREGNLLVGCKRGLWMLDADREQILPIKGLQGEVIALAPNGQDIELASRDGKLFRWRRDVGLVPAEISLNQPLQYAYLDYSGNWFLAPKDGGIWMQPTQDPTRFSLRVTQFDASGIPQPVASTGLIAHDGTLSGVTLSLMCLADATEVRYAWHVAGWSDSWSDLQQERHIQLSGIPPGEYLLHLKGTHPSGLEGRREFPLLVPDDRTSKGPSPLALGLGLLCALLGAALFWLYWRTRDHQPSHLNVARAASDLRSPLANLMSLVDTMQQEVSEEHLQKHLATVVAACRRLNRMMVHFINLTQYEADLIPLQCTPVDLHALCDVAIARISELDPGHETSFSNLVSPEMSDAFADERLMLQVFENLLGNALRHAVQGEISMAAEVARHEIMVTITAAGSGMSNEQVTHLFEVKEGGDIKGHSLLGLALTRRLVEAQDGRVWGAVSERGLHFSLVLPKYKGNVSGSNSPDSFISRPVTEQLSHAIRETVFSILVVDDDEVNRQVLVNQLALEGYHVFSAAGGGEALKLLDHQDIDLVLLDIMMPRMSGYEVCQQIRARFPVQELPIIFLTAKGQEQDVLAGFSLGANDYLAKPVSKQELVARVRTHLQLLDINRNLERIVSERTRELQAQNKQLIRTRNQMVMQEKMASLGTLTAGIAHEIRNPLNFVNNFSVFTHELSGELENLVKLHQGRLPELFMQQVGDILREMRENTEHISKYGKRANRIVESMMELVGGQARRPQETDINMLVEEFVAFAFHGKRDEAQAVELIRDWDPNVGFHTVVPQSLSRVVVSIVNNALEAMAAKHEVFGSAYQAQFKVWSKARVDGFELGFRDNGTGISENDMPHIFTPFFSTRPTGEGNIGLGLSIGYDIIVQEHGGRMDVSSNEGEYTEVRIILPDYGKPLLSAS